MGTITDVDKFLRTITNKNTKTTYEQALNGLGVCSLDLDIVKKCIEFCKVTQWGRDTIILYLSAVRSYSKFLQESNVITIEQWFFIQQEIVQYTTSLSKKQRHIFALPSGKDIENIINYLSSSPLTKSTTTYALRLLMINRRDRALFLLMLSTGLRVSEVANLTIDNIDFDAGDIRAVVKGGKIHTVTLSGTALDALKEYFDIRPDKFKLNKKNPLFSRHDRQIGAYKVSPLSARTIQNLFKSIRESNNIDYEFTPHTMRRLFASTEFRETGNFFRVRELLGHSSEPNNATETYIHQDLIK